MAEDVQVALEGSIPELELYEAHGVLSTEEIRSIITQREDFEYALKRRNPNVGDFRRAVRFEVALLKLIRLRAKKVSYDESIHRRFIPSRIVFILTRGLTRFRNNDEFFIESVEIAKDCGCLGAASRFCASFVRLFPTKEVGWLLGAGIPLSQGDFGTARRMLQKGLDLLKSSRALWLEYLRLEISFTIRLEERKAQLGALEEEAKEEEQCYESSGELLAAVMTNLGDAIGDQSSCLDAIVTLCQEFIETKVNVLLIRAAWPLLGKRASVKSKFVWNNFDRLLLLGLTKSSTREAAIGEVYGDDKRGLVTFLQEHGKIEEAIKWLFEEEEKTPGFIEKDDCVFLLKFDSDKYLSHCMERFPKFAPFQLLSLWRGPSQTITEFESRISSLDPESFLYAGENYLSKLWLGFFEKEDPRLQHLEKAILSIKKLCNEEASRLFAQALLQSEVLIPRERVFSTVKRIVHFGVPSSIGEGVFLEAIKRAPDAGTQKKLYQLGLLSNSKSKALWLGFHQLTKNFGTLEEQNNVYLRGKPFI